MSYDQARRLLLTAGLVVLVLVAGVMYVRRVDTPEVVAILLFIPVFVAFAFGGITGGIAGGVAASVAYGAVRYPQIEAVGAGRFVGLIIVRAIAYLAFGVIGGWATRQLQQSLTKLDLYDVIDDATGLYNARFFIQDTDLEMSRAERYRTLFSVVQVAFPVAALQALGKKKAHAVLNEFGQLLRDSVRTVDRPVHSADTYHRFSVVLPETATEGARIFVDRFAEKAREFLVQRGVQLGPDDFAKDAATFPGDEDILSQMRAEYAAIEAAEHPETAAALKHQ